MTIAEAAERYGLTADTLRYYEKIGLIPAVGRTAGGIRNYTDEDCRWIEFIKCMRSSGLPIDALIRYVALFQEGDATAGARKALLTEQRDALRERIAEMQKTLDRLDRKIAGYENTLRAAESRLPRRDAGAPTARQAAD